METLANLESFVRSAEAGSFSAAARRLALTPAAVSRNVAMLERNLGVRLFQRSTRRITLTEAGEQFLHNIGETLELLQGAIAHARVDKGEPAGTLRVSLPPVFGAAYVLSLLPEFLVRYPAIRIDWQFDNRPVDLIADHFDAAIGAGFDLAPGVVSRALAPAHVIAVAAPSLLEGRGEAATPEDLAAFPGIVMRSTRTGRLRHWNMRNAAGSEAPAALQESLCFDDPAAMVAAARLGLGVTLVSVPDALPHLESGELVRAAPGWYADAGVFSLYYVGRSLLPAKTRVFIDFVADAFKRQRFAERFSGSFEG
jgi:DNA-binding transcriptional LysR family regulator